MDISGSVSVRIITLGDELLHNTASPVDNIDGELEKFIEEMFDAMYRGNGIGLAAPQVADLRRMFICHVGNDVPRVFINPEIIGTSNEVVKYEEGCLSIPGVYEDLIRPEQVKVQAWNLKGKPFSLDAEGMLARVIQHEIDHLNGVLFIDRLSERKRERVVKLYEKMEKRQVRS